MAKLYLGTREITPAIYGGGGSKYGCTVDNLLGDVDSNGVLQMPPDTSGDIVFGGVKDAAMYALYYKYTNNVNLTHGVSFPDLEAFSGNYAAYLAFSSCRNLTSASFPNLTTISGNYACYCMFALCWGLTSASLPNLTIVSGNHGCRYMFQGDRLLTHMSFPELTTISGASGCGNMFSDCAKLISISFSKLAIVTGSYAMSYMFNSCREITDIYFNSLTTTSFGSYVDQFTGMFNSSTALTSGTCTLHFPSNLSSTISGLSGYPLFGGTSGRIILAFDLPATS